MKRLTLVAAMFAFATATAFAADDEKVEPGFNEQTFMGLEMRSIGPAFMSGRIADIAIDPNDQSTWYVGVGSGGVWKTDNKGTTWEAIFEDEDAYSIGCITIDPNNSNTIWVGTGENISGRHVGYGAGVYRSRDGGQNWEKVGLEDSEHIGMIRVDPRDSNIVFVAAQGPLWSAGGDRGLFKSTDGGKNWRKVLGDGFGNTDLDDRYTGVSEVHMDPRNPDVMYAVTWQRFRNVAALINGGPETAIHKSTDAGKTWEPLTVVVERGDLPCDNAMPITDHETGWRDGGESFTFRTRAAPGNDEPDDRIGEPGVLPQQRRQQHPCPDKHRRPDEPPDHPRPPDVHREGRGPDRRGDLRRAHRRPGPRHRRLPAPRRRGRLRDRARHYSHCA